MSLGSGSMGASSSTQVQVDVGAINANTDEIEEFIGNRTTPEAGSTNARLQTLIDNIGNDVATETTLAAIKTAVELIDNAIAGNEMQVDVITSALPTGASTEATLSAVSSALATLNASISLSNKRAFSEGTGVESVTDTATHSVSFGGFYIHKAVSLGAATVFTNQSGNSLVNVNLPVGYYPYKGTAFAFASAGGIATLIKD